MPCPELQRLRTQATQLNNQIKEQRRKALAKAHEVRQGRPSGRSELVPYLQRKLALLGAQIESHVAQHKCQE